MKTKFILSVIIILLVFSCRNEKRYQFVEYQKISGKTMGTSYHISYNSKGPSDIKQKVDSILVDINNAVSTYINSSTISIINQDSLASFLGEDNQDMLVYVLPSNHHFEENFSLSKKAFIATGGFFDPSVMPLVNYWGFGYKEKKAIESANDSMIQQLLKLTDFNKWSLENKNDSILVTKPNGAEIDFSAIAKGYAVDYISEYLESVEIDNFMVEIGGEIYCRGVNSKNIAWTIGLSRPEVTAKLSDFEALISLSDQAMASSGNYRNYYDIDGLLYGHEINPNTGYPEINSLLGVTIIEDNCAEADALATAFMVMGYKRTKEWLANNIETNAVLFYRSENGDIQSFATAGIVDKLKKL